MSFCSLMRVQMVNITVDLLMLHFGEVDVLHQISGLPPEMLGRHTNIRLRFLRSDSLIHYLLRRNVDRLVG